MTDHQRHPSAPLSGSRGAGGPDGREARRQAARSVAVRARMGDAMWEPTTTPTIEDVAEEAPAARRRGALRLGAVAAVLALVGALMLYRLAVGADGAVAPSDTAAVVQPSPQPSGLVIQAFDEHLVRVLADAAGNRFERGRVHGVDIGPDGQLIVTVGGEAVVVDQGDGGEPAVLDPGQTTDRALDTARRRALATDLAPDGQRWILADGSPSPHMRPARYRLVRVGPSGREVIGSRQGMPTDEARAWTSTRPASLVVDPAGRVWFSVYQLGLHVYDGRDFERIDAPGLRRGALDLAVDAKGDVWIVTFEGTLYRWSPAADHESQASTA